MFKWELMDEAITKLDRIRLAKFILTTKRFTNGPEVKKFESNWNEWLGSRNSLFVSSGSTANFLLVSAVKEKYGLKEGAKVLVPACTWMTNVAPIIQLGLKPIFCDINLENYSFSDSGLEEISKIHPDIEVIFISHLLGLPGNTQGCRKFFPKAILLDDICESHGITDPWGDKIGSNSTGSTFSFYFGHHMTTIEGGMVSTNDEELYDLMKMKRSHGLARESLYFRKYSSLYPDIDKSFLFITDGYNFRNHEVCAKLGNSQLRRLDSNIRVRRENFSRYFDIVSQFEDILYCPSFTQNNSSFCFPLVVRDRKDYLPLKESLVRRNVEFRPIVGGNLLRHPFLEKYCIEGKSDASLANILNDQGIYVGNSQFVGEKHLAILKAALEDLR